MFISSLSISQNIEKDSIKKEDLKIAPDFTTKDIKGNTIKLSDLKGKIVVLNFWFTSCKPCIEELPELNKIQKKYESNTNVVFISITFDSKKKVDKFLKKYDLNFLKVTDARDLCNLFEIKGYPTNLIIDQNGYIYDSIMGGNEGIEDYLTIVIQKALEGKPKNDTLGNRKTITLTKESKFKLDDGTLIELDEAIKYIKTKKYLLVIEKDEKDQEYFLLKEKK